MRSLLFPARFIAAGALLAAAAGCKTAPDPEPAPEAAPLPLFNAETWHITLETTIPRRAVEADRLLEDVARTGGRDPEALMRVHLVTQLTLASTWAKAPALREVWTSALLRAAEHSDPVRARLALDELAFSIKPAQLPRLRTIAEKHPDERIRTRARDLLLDLSARK